jgi:hypothetical protein
VTLHLINLLVLAAHKFMLLLSELLLNFEEGVVLVRVC